MNRARRRRVARETGWRSSKDPGAPGPADLARAVMDRNTAQEEQRRAAEAEVEARALKLGKLWESIPEQLHGTPQACLMVARLATSWSHPVPPELAERWYQEWEEFVRAEVPEVTAAAAGLWVPGMAS